MLKIQFKIKYGRAWTETERHADISDASHIHACEHIGLVKHQIQIGEYNQRGLV